MKFFVTFHCYTNVHDDYVTHLVYQVKVQTRFSLALRIAVRWVTLIQTARERR